MFQYLKNKCLLLRDKVLTQPTKTIILRTSHSPFEVCESIHKEEDDPSRLEIFRKTPSSHKGPFQSSGRKVGTSIVTQRRGVTRQFSVLSIENKGLQDPHQTSNGFLLEQTGVLPLLVTPDSPT